MVRPHRIYRNYREVQTREGPDEHGAVQQCTRGDGAPPFLRSHPPIRLGAATYRDADDNSQKAGTAKPSFIRAVIEEEERRAQNGEPKLLNEKGIQGISGAVYTAAQETVRPRCLTYDGYVYLCLPMLCPLLTVLYADALPSTDPRQPHHLRLRHRQPPRSPG